MLQSVSRTARVGPCFRERRYCFDRISPADVVFAAERLLPIVGRESALFVDRDGTVIVEKNYASDPDQIEFEPGAVSDLQEVLESIAPQGRDWRHHLRWDDRNGHSHVRSALLGPSLSVPFVGGELCLGTWQQVVLVDFDDRPRSREVVVQFMGE